MNAENPDHGVTQEAFAEWITQVGRPDRLNLADVIAFILSKRVAERLQHPSQEPEMLARVKDSLMFSRLDDETWQVILSGLNILNTKEGKKEASTSSLYLSIPLLPILTFLDEPPQGVSGYSSSPENQLVVDPATV